MVAAVLEQHGVAEMLDVLAAYAELRCQHEPGNCSAAEEEAQGGWCRIADPAVRRIIAKAELLAAGGKSRKPHRKNPLWQRFGEGIVDQRGRTLREQRFLTPRRCNHVFARKTP
jgi:hypothetical protein